MDKSNSKRKNIPALFLSFLKIGAFTFGGGYAMLPIIQKEMVEKHGWITEGDLLDIFAISQVTPGVIAVNAATYVGYTVGGFWGSFFATLGVVLPSFVVICVISLVLDAFMAIEPVKYAFYGIRMCVIVLLVMAVVKLAKADKLSVFYFILLGACFVLASFTSFDVILVLVCAAAAGVFYAVVKRRRAEK